MKKRHSIGFDPLPMLLSMLLYAAYFFYLVRDEFMAILSRNQALESLGLVAVPGTAFLQEAGALFVFKSSLFFLLLIGLLILAFQGASLVLRSRALRAVYLLIGLAALCLLLRDDRILFSFMAVTALSFASFFVLTFQKRSGWSLLEVFNYLLIALLVAAALYLGGSKGDFFIKARDRILLDSALGGGISGFYYAHSPLAAGVVSKPKGVFQGLVYMEGFKEAPFLHLGGGMVMSGRRAAAGGADFVIRDTGRGFMIEDRHGRELPVRSPEKEEILEAADRLFAMEGFKKLNGAALYYFPAGLMLALLAVLRRPTRTRRVFIAVSWIPALGAAGFIAATALAGRMEALPPEPPGGAGNKAEILSLCYHMNDEKKVPYGYLPLLREMASSESAALRYWAGRLMGIHGDPAAGRTLEELLRDPSPNVRYTAALSLYKVMGRESLRSLWPLLLDDPSWYVKCKIFSAFLRSGTIPRRNSGLLPG